MRFSIQSLLFLIALSISHQVEAQTLTFSPQRIVVDARAGSTSLTLTNSGSREESYRVELVDMIYQDDGKIAEAKTTPAGYPSAKNLIRFSPSQIRLAAGEQQTIRILIRADETVADGEYRVHAVLRQLPNVAQVKKPDLPNTLAGVVGIEQSVAIPVILRKGATSATGTIASLKLTTEGKNPSLDLQLARAGTRSLYTNLILRDKAGAVSKEVKGVAVPVPNQKRRFIFGLEGIDAAKLRGGGYSLEMIDHDAGTVLDKKAVQ